MNPYPARIDELHQHLQNRFGVKDTSACDILLACLLDSQTTGAQKPWLIVETDWMRRDSTDAWFNFGGLAGAQSLAEARIQRHGPMEVMINAWLQSRALGCAGIFVDAEWRRPAELTQGCAHESSFVSAYGDLLAGCVRLRTDYPKTGWASLATETRTRDLAELKRLAARVLDSQYRVKVTGRDAQAPGGMFYWCELLQRLSYVQRDWNMLVWSLCQIVRNVCTLWNEPDRAPEWKLAERVVHDSVNYATGEIIGKAYRRENIRTEDPYTGSRGYRHNSIWQKEVMRLCRAGVLHYRGGAKKDREKWNRLNGNDWYRLVDHRERLFA